VTAGEPRVIVGLFDDVEKAAQAARALLSLPLPEENVTTISSVPLPDGAVVRDRRPIRFPWIVVAFWLVGALGGLALTLVTYQVYPMVTAGKPINTVPPAIIVSFEGGMFAALIATLVAGFRSIGLRPFRPGKKLIFDPRIHEGKIALCARVDPGDQERLAIEAMKASGGDAVRVEEGEL
jgi:hypothetical protein